MFKIEKNVFVLSLTVGGTLLFFYSWYYLLPIHLQSLGASDRQIGISYTLFALGFTLAQTLGGYLTDRFGRRPVVVIPTYLFPIFYLLLAFAKVWWVCVLFYLFASISSAVQMPAFTAMISESSQRKGRAFGFFEFIIACGIALGPLLGGILIDKIGIKGLFIITAFATLISAILRSCFLTEANGLEKQKVSIQTHLTKNYIWFLVTGVFIFLVLNLTMNGPFLTLFQREVLSISLSRINLFFAVGGLFSAFSALLGGYLVDKYGAKPVLGLSLLLHPLFLVFWVSTAGVSPFFFFSFIFSQMFYLCYQVIITDMSAVEVRGRMLGIFGTVTGLISSIGPFIGMQLKLSFGWSYPFYLALLFGVSGLLSLLNVRLKKV